MGKYRSLGNFFDRIFRNDLNKNFEDIDTDIKVQKARVDNLITANPQPSEVVDLRTDTDGTVHGTAWDRFASDETKKTTKFQEISVQLAENAEQVSQKALLENGKKGVYYFEQLNRTWYGRGQLTAEVPFETVNGRTNFSQGYAIGTTSVTVADASKFVTGAVLAVEYDDGNHDTYFCLSVSGNNLVLLPPLKKAVTTASKIERAWHNSAHAGEYALKAIGEQLANATYDDVDAGEIISEMNMNETDTLNQIKPIGTTAITQLTASSISGSNYGEPLTAMSNSSVKLGILAAYNGARTTAFNVKPSSKVIFDLGIRASNGNGILRIKTLEERTLLKAYTIPVNGVFQHTKISLDVPQGVSKVYLEFSSDVGAVDLFLDDLKVREVMDKGYLIPRNAKIVMLFDSWGNFPVNGIEQRLTALMPKATIINKGIGGDTATDMLNRFDTDVAPYKPHVVICDTGVNDAYNMGNEDTTAYIQNLKKLADKCKEINATIIFLGLPALPETDPRTTHTQWQLTNRSRNMAFDARKSVLNYSILAHRPTQIDVPVHVSSLAAGAKLNLSLGVLPANATVKIKVSGGYLLTSSVLLQVGFTDDANNALLGNANELNLGGTHYYQKTNSNYEKPEFFIRNNSGGSKFLMVRIVNNGATAYTGSALVSVEI